MNPIETALVVGVGPGLGAALVRCFAAAGMRVAAAARQLDPLEKRVADIEGDVQSYACDATDETAVRTLFQQVSEAQGPLQLVVFNAGAFVPRGILDTSTEEFEHCWRVGCLGGFLVGREAAARMLAASPDAGHRGTLLFTGATASLRGSAGFHNLAVGKFGLRALAQSMARELQPKGIHVAHVLIDGQIASERHGFRIDERGPNAVLHPDAIAETYLQLHRQPANAWTHELDLRPSLERF